MTGVISWLGHESQGCCFFLRENVSSHLQGMAECPNLPSLWLTRPETTRPLRLRPRPPHRWVPLRNRRNPNPRGRRGSCRPSRRQRWRRRTSPKGPNCSPSGRPGPNTATRRRLKASGRKSSSLNAAWFGRAAPSSPPACALHTCSCPKWRR